jgi:hypothetical protein
MEKDKAEEPEIAYQNKTIRFFSSFKEAEEAEAKENALLSPLEHLQSTTALIERLYADKIASVTNPYKDINFINFAYLD